VEGIVDLFTQRSWSFRKEDVRYGMQQARDWCYFSFSFFYGRMRKNTMFIAFIRSRVSLFIVGIVCEFFYFFYLLQHFPLLHIYPKLIDIGTLTGATQTNFLLFILVFSILFALAGYAWWLVWHRNEQLNNRGTLWLILGFGTIFALTGIFVYPVNAIDVFNYIAESILLVEHHANPMIVSLVKYPQDPQVNLTAAWGVYPAAYGPLGLCIDAIPTLLVGRNVLANLILLKVMFSGMLLVEAYVAYRILSKIGPKFALAAVVALAWNPFAILEYSADSHNDIMMVFFVLLAVLALVEKRPVLALVLVTASALTKYSSLPLIPIFFVYSFSHQSGYRQRLRYAALAIGASLLLTLVLFAPFWAGPRTFASFSLISDINLSSFNLFVNDISAQAISLDQGRRIGMIVFAWFYCYALILSSRGIEQMLRASFIAMFALVAFGVSNIEVWYLIWPFALGILIPSVGNVVVAALCVVGATLTEVVHGFLWVWVNVTNTFAFNIINSIAYLVIFFPALVLLLVLEGRRAGHWIERQFAMNTKDKASDTDEEEQGSQPQPQLLAHASNS
jgi:hypothetical protein